MWIDLIFLKFYQAAKADSKEKDAADAVVLSKASLDIDLLPQTEEDTRLASLLLLNPSMSKFHVLFHSLLENCIMAGMPVIWQ